MSLQLRNESPRCFCGELWIDRKQHLVKEHSELVFYHLLLQMGRLLKLNEIISTVQTKCDP